MAIAKGFSEPTDRIKKLKARIIDAMPTVEADRAELLTEAYKKYEGATPVIRNARANEAIFNGIPVTIRPGELIVGALTVTDRGCQIYPEFSYDWVEAEFDTMATRKCDPFEIPEDTKRRLSEVFKYWPGKTNSDLAHSLMSDKALECQAEGVFTVGNYYFGGIGHVCVDYGKVLRVGFSGIVKEAAEKKAALDPEDPETIVKTQFYDAVIITYNAAINLAHRYAAKALEMAQTEINPQRKKELLQIAQNCANVPEKPAQNFWEACQAFWFVQLIMHLESSGHSISPGRFDQYMYPYYQNDTIDRDFAQELVDCIFIKLNDLNKTRDAISDELFAGYAIFQNMCAGGQTPEGLDATNDVSYMQLDAIAHVGLPQPSMSIRYWDGTPDEFLLRACEVVRLGHGLPAMYSDEVAIPMLENDGVCLEDARDWLPIGCVEPQPQHKADGWHDAAFFNCCKVLDITLHNGKSRGKQLGPKTGEMTEMQTFEDFVKAYEEQMKFFVHYLVESDNCVDYAHMMNMPMPFESALVDGCLDKGKSVQEGAAKYNFTGPQAFGTADVIDSFVAVKQNVFEDHKYTMAEMMDAIDNNFGYTVDPNFNPTGSDREQGCGTAPASAGGGSTRSAMEQKVWEVVQSVLGESNAIDLSALNGGEPVVTGASAGSDQLAKWNKIHKQMLSAPHFGNDIPEVDLLGRRVTKIYSSEVHGQKNPRGGIYHAGCYTVSANVGMGRDVDALPDGRLAQSALSDNISPRHGFDVSGPTAANASSATIDALDFGNGTLLNQKLLPSAVAGDEGLKRFAALVRAYFDHKGYHIQFNIVNRESLLEAQAHPEQHKDLIVRVAGYSAQFVVLAKDVQDDIIARTEQTFE